MAVTAPEFAPGQAMSMRVERLYRQVQKSMFQSQEEWRPESVLLDEKLRDLPLILRRAHAMAKVLDTMPIEIGRDEIIVGRTARGGTIVRTFPGEFATTEEHAKARAEGSGITSSLSHKTPDYTIVPGIGLRALIEGIELRQASLEIATVDEKADTEREEKRLFFESMKIELLAVIRLALRFADLAESMAAEATAERAAELLEIATILRRVPELPARGFREALQAFWLVHFAFYSSRSALSLGRIDQFLWPYLEADLQAGRITLEQAQELADLFWLKCNDRASLRRADQAAKVTTHQTRVGYRFRTLLGTDQADALNHFGQNCLLGGVRPDGQDGTNELSYLFLNCLERFEFTSPVVTVRLHRKSPQRLIRRTAEVLKKGGGMPYIDNDDAIVEAYTRLGVRVEDACDYSNSNCWETMIAGKSDQELLRGINFLLILEWALGRGYTRARQTQEGIDTGDPLSFSTFDDLLSAWKAQLDALVRRNIEYLGENHRQGTLFHSSHGKYSYNPLLSALTLDCIEKGKDVIRGGARYTIWHVMGEAVANGVDALLAIKHLVYETKQVELAEILRALETNWQGYESLRQMMIARAPKFANDLPEADSLARELMDYFVARTRCYAAHYPEIIFPCSVGTFSWYASIGCEVGASADGRFEGEPVTPNFSPTLGMDLNGPTAALKSYCQMPGSDLAAGAPLDLRFSGSALKGEAGTERLRAFLQAFVILGGNMMTVTVTDADTLKAAMRDPEKYRGLRVRMGGWSAYFVALSPEQQLLHIQRIEHG